MGFRNPATSASAVNTGAGRVPGVKVYSQPGNPASGVVEWDAYTAQALATLTSSMTGSGGTNWLLALLGGPQLGLNIEQQAGGGYLNALRIAHADILDFGNPSQVTGLPRYGSSSGSVTAAFGGSVAWEARNGWGMVSAWLSAPSGWAGSTLLCTLPSGAHPDGSYFFQANISGDSTRYCLCWLQPGGQLYLMGAASGSNDVRLSFAYPLA